jgi:hypothetical protein
MKFLIIAAFSVLALSGCACCGNSGGTTTYVCQCGEDCPKCKTTSDQPGTCACGKPLVAR